MIVTGDLALTWWLLMIAPGLIGAILGFSFTGNARGLVAGAVLGPLAMIALLILGGSAHAQLPHLKPDAEQGDSVAKGFEGDWRCHHYKQICHNFAN
jgi:hypothetical protein